MFFYLIFMQLALKSRKISLLNSKLTDESIYLYDGENDMKKIGTVNTDAVNLTVQANTVVVIR